MTVETRTDPDHDRTHVRRFLGGLAVSLVLHVLAFVVFAGQALPPSPFAAAGERRGDDRAAAGGGMQAVDLRVPETEPPVPPEPDIVAAPVIEVELPEPEPMIEEVPVVALAEGTGLSSDEGPADGPGLVDGVGRGDGGSDDEGRFRVLPPRPRGMILPPPDRPSSVRGREVEVWVYVSAGGQVVPDSTRINPATGDRRFDRRLREHAAGWVFEAARRDGRPVPEWFRYTIVM